MNDLSAHLYPTALTLYQAERLADAEVLLRRLLGMDPRHHAGLHLLGLIGLRDGRVAMAVDMLIQAVLVDGSVPRYHSHLGNALRARGWPDKAEACYRMALELKPDYPEASNNLGAALQDLGRLEEAVDCHRRAIELKPDYVEAHTNLGAALNDLGRRDEAVACHQAALAIAPDSWAAHNNLGTALQELGRRDEALASFRRAVAIKPDYFEAHTNLGNALNALGRSDQAVECHRRALAVAPDFPEANWNLALALLQRGEYAEGWRQYQWRWRRRAVGQEKWRAYPQPVWDGAASENGTLFIWTEQGLGDNLHFVRYAEAAARLGWRVILEAPRALFRLFAAIPGIQVVTEGEPPPPFDVHCPLLGLPLAFATTLDTIPAAIPYLTAPARPLAERPGLKVGIAWRGRKSNKRDRVRSLEPALFGQILDLPGLAVVSLQKDARAEELTALGGPFNAGPDLGDFADTAALVAGLDLVISVDTSICHLAGALGVPTWTLLDSAPDWRWLLGRDDSPWYPTMRLFRQKRPGEWAEVVERVRAELGRRTRPSA